MTDLPLQKWWLELMRTGTLGSHLCTAPAIRPLVQNCLATRLWPPPGRVPRELCLMVRAVELSSLHLVATRALP